MRAPFHFVVVVAVVVAAIGVASCVEPSPAPVAPVAPVATAAPVVADAAVADAAAVASEIEARLLLEQAFRDAGLRVLVDVPFDAAGATVTLDGFDPERGIGYEYVAASERGTDLDDRERQALATAAPQVLILDATTAAELSDRAAAFLARAAPATEP